MADGTLNHALPVAIPAAISVLPTPVENATRAPDRQQNHSLETHPCTGKLPAPAQLPAMPVFHRKEEETTKQEQETNEATKVTELEFIKNIEVKKVWNHENNSYTIPNKVKVVLKRYGGSTGNGYSDGRLSISFDSMQVLVEGKPVKLTQLEFKLLSYLVKNENKVVSKQELFENVWEDKFTGDGTLNVHIRRIREAIEREPGNPGYIITIWGGGYKFCGEKQ